MLARLLRGCGLSAEVTGGTLTATSEVISSGAVLAQRLAAFREKAAGSQFPCDAWLEYADRLCLVHHGYGWPDTPAALGPLLSADLCCGRISISIRPAACGGWTVTKISRSASEANDTGWLARSTSLVAGHLTLRACWETRWQCADPAAPALPVLSRFTGFVQT